MEPGTEYEGLRDEILDGLRRLTAPDDSRPLLREVSYLALDLVRRIIADEPFPDGVPQPLPGANVIYVDAESVPQIISERAGVKVEIAPHPQEMGAFGAALFAAESLATETQEDNRLTVARR